MRRQLRKSRLIWPGIASVRDVEVLGGPPQEQVADAPPYQVGDEAVRMEPVERAQGVRADQLPGYAVFLPGNDSWFHALHHSMSMVRLASGVSATIKIFDRPSPRLVTR